MGNFLTAMATVMAPFLAKEVFIPAIYHPYKGGGIPFVPPSTIQYTFYYTLFIMLIVGSMATISGMMTTARECRKVQFWTALTNARWAMLFALIAMIILFFLPFIKAPILSLVSWIPYANHWVTGFLMAILVLVGGMFANNLNLKQVCVPEPQVPLIMPVNPFARKSKSRR